MIYVEKPDGFASDFQAVGCFVESDGRILQLLRNKSKKLEPGKWGGPAGHIETGEDPALAMVREFWEETGIRVSPSQLKFVYTFFVNYYPPKFLYHVFWLSFSFRPEIKLSPEHSAYVWIPPAFANSLDLMKDEWECIKLVYGLQ